MQPLLGWLKLRPGLLWETRVPSLPSLAPLLSTDQYDLFLGWMAFFATQSTQQVEYCHPESLVQKLEFPPHT